MNIMRPLALVAACVMLAGAAVIGQVAEPKDEFLKLADKLMGEAQRLSGVNIVATTGFYGEHNAIGLPFYWRRTCTLVGYRGELDFGLRQEPWRWIPNLQQFALDWQHERDALAVMRAEDYRQLAALGLPMRVIYTAPSLVAVVRQ